MRRYPLTLKNTLNEEDFLPQNFGGCDRFNPYAPLIKAIRSWPEKDRRIRCSHIHREVNQVADFMANISRTPELETHLMEIPPSRCS
ncbi:hypothetical protein Lal_00023800 [Lupinus albus]|nr:hypothetical protein Lal_00023800 [Lupinus albus]